MDEPKETARAAAAAAEDRERLEAIPGRHIVCRKRGERGGKHCRVLG